MGDCVDDVAELIGGIARLFGSFE